MYRYIHNLQGDIIGIVDANGALVVEYKYDAWGRPTSISGSLSTFLGSLNPFRYRGYVWDEETSLYYLRNRYYASTIDRFINTDLLLSRKKLILSQNAFTYCSNLPIVQMDADGFGASGILIILFVVVIGLGGCSRTDESSAPNLERNKTPSYSYNCYGNAIGKEVNSSPIGYVPGDSTRSVFEAVKRLVGENNIVERKSLFEEIGDDEYMVALRCGDSDYHFIVYDDGVVYNKQGLADLVEGCTIDCIEKGAWYTHFHTDEQKLQYDRIIKGNKQYYDYELIYFSIKRDWSTY